MTIQRNISEESPDKNSLMAFTAVDPIRRPAEVKKMDVQTHRALVAMPAAQGYPVDALRVIPHRARPPVASR